MTAQGIFDRLLSARWLVLIVCVAVQAVMLIGSDNLSFRSDYKVYFSENDERRVAFESVEAEFSKNDNVVFVLADTSADLLDGPLLEASEDLTESAWRLPFATRVDSINNFQYSRADNEGVIVESLAENTASMTRADRERVFQRALQEPNLLNRAINPSGTALGVNVTFTLPDDVDAQRRALEEIGASVRGLADEVRNDYPGLTVALTGIVMQNRAFAESSLRDTATLYPLLLLMVFIVTMIALRSFTASLLSMIVISFGALSTLGVWGWLGLTLNNTSFISPIVILTIAVADSVHLIAHAQRRYGLDTNKSDAITDSLRVNFWPVAITSITTSIGYLSLNFAVSPPIREFGQLTAIGALFSFIYSITLLPALMRILPLRKRKPRQIRGSGRGWWTPIVEKASWPIVIAFAALVAVAGMVIPRVELDDNFVEYFDPSIDFRRDTDFAADHLSGPYVLQVRLDSGEEGGALSPEFLKKAERLTEWLETRDEVVHVGSVTNTIKRLNMNFTSGEEGDYKIPADQDLISQLFLVYEISLPYGLDLTNQISLDKSAIRMFVTLKPLRSTQIRALEEDIAVWGAKEHAAVRALDVVGPILMFAHISERNIQSMTWGTLLAIGLIAACIIAMLRSFKLGLVSIAANLAPLILTLGLWTLFIGRIGMVSSILVVTALGVMVDSQIHFLWKYRSFTDGSFQERLTRTFELVMGPIVSTTLIIAIGFSILVASTFLVTAHMGLLTATAIALSLSVDLIFLPALISIIDRNPRKESGHAPVAF